MGLFDLFRTKKQPAETVKEEPSTEGYLGDLAKTQLIRPAVDAKTK